MLGVMPPADALSIAKEKNLSLVEVQAHAVPPVWKLKEAPANAARAAAAAALGGGTSTAAPPDGKKERSSKPKKPPKEKEVRLTDSIAPRDAEHKIQSALKFLEKGHVVRVLVLNQGKRDPENKKKALAVTLIEQVCDACAEHASVSDIMGATGLRAAGETALTTHSLGPAFAILTPRDGAFRQPATPRAPRKGDRRGRRWIDFLGDSRASVHNHRKISLSPSLAHTIVKPSHGGHGVTVPLYTLPLTFAHFQSSWPGFACGRWTSFITTPLMLMPLSGA